MTKCIECGQEIKKESQYCPFCACEQTVKTTKLKNGDMDKIIKKYKDVINAKQERDFISLGPLSVNLSVGNIKGIPSGRIVQIVGRESSGKTTLALDIVAQYQKQFSDRFVVWVDYERSWDENYAKACGVDIDRVYRLTPDDAEEGYSIVLESIKSGGIKLVVVDSIPTSIPSAETTKSLTDNAKMAGSASIITRFCQHVVPILDNYNATLIAINQYRKNFSTLSPIEEVPFGGMALQYATSVMIALARTKTEADKQRVQSIIKKNKTAKPQARAEFSIEYGQGINHAACAIEMAKELGIVELRGSWYVYRETRAQGLNGAIGAFDMDNLIADVVAMINERGLDYVE